AQDEFAALAQGRLQRMKSREEPEGNQNAEPEPEEDLDDDPVPGPQKKLPRVTNKPGMMQTLDEAGEIVQDIYNFMLEELMDIVASKKQRTKAEEKGKGDEDEEAEPMDPDDPNEDASSNKTVNKSQSINLHTKCMIVEYALDAQEKGEVASVEKHVMEKFKKYFYSVEKNRFKTGLLSKWV
ncbi:unnamed protein product, partial [Durusdinium trenchii]